MELNAVQVMVTVAEPHDSACLGARGDGQLVRKAVFLDHQRMIARHRKICRAVGEQVALDGIRIGALDARQLAMDRRVDTAKRAAECGGKRLMPETDAKNGRGAGGGADQLDCNSGILRRPGAGRQHQPLGCTGQNLVRRCRVIAHDLDLGTKVRQEVPQVPGKAVVVVDQDEHCAGRPLNRRRV